MGSAKVLQRKRFRSPVQIDRLRKEVHVHRVASSRRAACSEVQDMDVVDGRDGETAQWYRSRPRDAIHKILLAEDIFDEDELASRLTIDDPVVSG